MNVLREIKHLGFLVRKALSKSKTLLTVKDSIFMAYSKIRPFRFRRTRYLESWLRFTAVTESSMGTTPPKLYCIWAGNNPMSPNRVKSLHAIREKNSGIVVELVGPDNLQEFVLPEHPLHPAYEFLSLVHKADYLRAYLMHFYGGAYCDIKEPKNGWAEIVMAMDGSPDVWMRGYQELSSKMCAQMDGRLGRDIRRNFSRLVGNGGFVMRSRTALTSEWLSEVERRLSYFECLLREIPGNERGDNQGYPVPWTALLGQVLQPLQLKYLDHIEIENRLLLSFENYK